VFLDKIHIKLLCKKYGIKNYIINANGTIDVDGNVSLSDRHLKKLPLKFREVTGYFSCEHNKLTTLEGAPESVDGYFNCSDNQLTTLEYAPKFIGSHFDCSHNRLTTLEGAPQSVDGYFECKYNQLTTLEGAQKSIIDRYFDCSYNKLTTLKGLPKASDYKFKGVNPEHMVTAGFGHPKYISDFNPICDNKFFEPYLQIIKHIHNQEKIPNYLVTPGLLALLKEKDPEIYKKVKELTDEESTKIKDILGDFGFD
jgi:hypothetical protein